MTWTLEASKYNTTTEIDKYRNLINKEKEIISDHEIIIGSLTESLVREVKNICMPYSEKMMNGAWEQHKLTNKSEKKMFLFMEEDLIERLFDESERKYVSLEKIMKCGQDDHAYIFKFKYENETKHINFELDIPNVKKARKENLDYMNYGKYRFLYEKKFCYWSIIKESYDLDEIADAIREFLIDVKFFQKGE